MLLLYLAYLNSLTPAVPYTPVAFAPAFSSGSVFRPTVGDGMHFAGSFANGVVFAPTFRLVPVFAPSFGSGTRFQPTFFPPSP